MVRKTITPTTIPTPSPPKKEKKWRDRQERVRRTKTARRAILSGEREVAKEERKGEKRKRTHTTMLMKTNGGVAECPRGAKTHLEENGCGVCVWKFV